MLETSSLFLVRVSVAVFRAHPDDSGQCLHLKILNHTVHHVSNTHFCRRRESFQLPGIRMWLISGGLFFSSARLEITLAVVKSHLFSN